MIIKGEDQDPVLTTTQIDDRVQVVAVTHVADREQEVALIHDATAQTAETRKIALEIATRPIEIRTTLRERTRIADKHLSTI